ncbi:hypothetical protein V2J09_003764 [Rumex salicifolius]
MSIQRQLADDCYLKNSAFQGKDSDLPHSVVSVVAVAYCLYSGCLLSVLWKPSQYAYAHCTPGRCIYSSSYRKKKYNQIQVRKIRLVA